MEKMFEIIVNFLTVWKWDIKNVLLLFFISLFVILIPESIITRNNLLFISTHKEYFYYSLIFSLGILIINLIQIVYYKYKKLKFKKITKKFLKKISIESYDFAVLYSLYRSANKTHYLPLNDGSIKILMRRGLVNFPSNHLPGLYGENMEHLVQYCLTSLAIELIEEDSSLFAKFTKVYQ